MRIRVYIFMFVFAALTMRSQEVQFSQFYTQVLQLNPAFAGATQQYRVSAGYRNQWPELPEAFVSYTAAFDAYIPEINSGVGLSVLRDRAGSGALSQTRINGAYAYTFRLSDALTVRPAISFGYYQRGIDTDRLVFGDQLIRGTNRSTVEQFEQQKGFFDASAGGLIYSKNVWLGFSALHLNQPNESFKGDISNLPTFYSMHMGARIVLKKDRFGKVEKAIWAAANFKGQNESVQSDVGFYAQFDPITFGIWYRGIDWRQANPNAFYNNRDAIIPTIGVKTNGFSVAYSYDITISKLSGATGGAHEIGLVYEFIDPRPKKRKFRTVPCPAF